MKLFGWMQNKLNGKQGNRKQNTVSSTNHIKQESREEFNDWPHGLLAIGTFGNNTDLTQNPETQEIQENPSPSEETLDFTPEEVGKLQKELTKLLSRKPNSDVQKQIQDLPLDRFLNCPSSLEVDRRISDAPCSNSDFDRDEDIERTISVIIGKCKDICADNKKAIGKKSVSFLLKKIFACRSGFAPAPSLRDTLQENRMEKLLRTMLHKKIYSQSSSRTSSMAKYIEDRHIPKKENEDDEKKTKINDGCKWVKTDSEYIVLEI